MCSFIRRKRSKYNCTQTERCILVQNTTVFDSHTLWIIKHTPGRIATYILVFRDIPTSWTLSDTPDSSPTYPRSSLLPILSHSCLICYSFIKVLMHYCPKLYIYLSIHFPFIQCDFFLASFITSISTFEFPSIISFQIHLVIVASLPPSPASHFICYPLTSPRSHSATTVSLFGMTAVATRPHSGPGEGKVSLQHKHNSRTIHKRMCRNIHTTNTRTQT